MQFPPECETLHALSNCEEIMDDSLILKTIADNIRIERLRKRLSQEKLAEIIGISTKYLNMIENNKTNPTIVIVVKICNALKIDLNTLIKL